MPPRFRFGAFEFDATTGDLHRLDEGLATRLAPQPEWHHGDTYGTRLGGLPRRPGQIGGWILEGLDLAAGDAVAVVGPTSGRRLGLRIGREAAAALAVGAPPGVP